MRREGATYVRTRSEHNDCHEHKLRHFRSVTILAPRISQYILTSYCASHGSPPCTDMPTSNWHSTSWENTKRENWEEDGRGDVSVGWESFKHFPNNYSDYGGSSWDGDDDQRTADPWVSDRWTASTGGSSHDYTRTFGWRDVSENPKGEGKGNKGKPNCGDHQPGKGEMLTFKSWSHAFYK